jgi:hypothetical protein
MRTMVVDLPSEKARAAELPTLQPTGDTVVADPAELRPHVVAASRPGAAAGPSRRQDAPVAR